MPAGISHEVSGSLQHALLRASLTVACPSRAKRLFVRCGRLTAWKSGPTASCLNRLGSCPGEWNRQCEKPTINHAPSSKGGEIKRRTGRVFWISKPWGSCSQWGNALPSQPTFLLCTDFVNKGVGVLGYRMTATAAVRAFFVSIPITEISTGWRRLGLS